MLWTDECALPLATGGGVLENSRCRRNSRWRINLLAWRLRVEARRKGLLAALVVLCLIAAARIGSTFYQIRAGGRKSAN